MELKVITGKKIKKIGLAFGGGGARGYALIGVIKAFEENNLKFDYIAGTSVGSLIGALYSYGMPSSDMYEKGKILRKKDIRKNKIPFTPSKTDGIEQLLESAVGKRINFEDLKTPFCAVAVDVRTGNEVHITSGDLFKAVCGSCAVPAVFSPVEYDKYLLFDGGLQNTIPANVPKMFGCDAVIGVDINSSRGQGTQSSKFFDLMLTSIDIMMKSNTIKGYVNADIMIQPDLKKFKSIKLDGFEEMVAEGYNATMEKMPEILKLFAKRKTKKSFFRFFRFPRKKVVNTKVKEVKVEETKVELKKDNE